MRLFEKHDDYIFSCILATDAAVCVCVCVCTSGGQLYLIRPSQKSFLSSLSLRGQGGLGIGYRQMSS